MTLEKYIELFSEDRIKSYQNTEEHDKNLKLIQNITPSLAMIELILRNRIDQIMIEKDGLDWIFDMIKAFEPRLQDKSNKLTPIEKRLYTNITSVLNKEKDKELSHAQILSRLSFGFWVDMIFYMVYGNKAFDCNKILDVKNIDVAKYSGKNKEIKNDKVKIRLLFKLVKAIRNRAFHWENLLKYKKENKGDSVMRFPNIYTKEGKTKGVSIGVCPDKIEIFLIDILKRYDVEMI